MESGLRLFAFDGEGDGEGGEGGEDGGEGEGSRCGSEGPSYTWDSLASGSVWRLRQAAL